MTATEEKNLKIKCVENIINSCSEILKLEGKKNFLNTLDTILPNNDSLKECILYALKDELI